MDAQLDAGPLTYQDVAELRTAVGIERDGVLAVGLARS
jgi:hypothetical protein